MKPHAINKTNVAGRNCNCCSSSEKHESAPPIDEQFEGPVILSFI